MFDEPVLPVTKDPEGVFRAGNRMRLLKLGASLAAAKLADDAVDGAIGATKARYFKEAEKQSCTRETQSRLSPDAPAPRGSPVRPNAATLAGVLSLAIPMATLQLPR